MVHKGFNIKFLSTLVYVKLNKNEKNCHTFYINTNNN